MVTGPHAALRLVLILLAYMLAVAACAGLLYTSYYERTPLSLPLRTAPPADLPPAH